MKININILSHKSSGRTHNSDVYMVRFSLIRESICLHLSDNSYVGTGRTNRIDRVVKNRLVNRRMLITVAIANGY